MAGRHTAPAITEFDPSITTEPERITVSELCDRYQALADRYYRRRDGTQTATPACIRDMMRPLREAAAEHYADTLDWMALIEHIQQELANTGKLARTTINGRIGEMRTMLKWATKRRYVPASALAGAQAVEYLKPGRSPAYETDPVKPVRYEVVEKVANHARTVLRAMIWTQLYCGCRPGELVIMRPCDITFGDRIWKYEPSRHKTEHLNKRRVIYLGPKAQAQIRPFLHDRESEDFLFSAAEAEQERRAAKRRNRKSYESCGNRPGTNRRRHPKQQPGDRYTTGTYADAVQRACFRAIPAPPHLMSRKKKRQKTRLTDREKARLAIVEQVHSGQLTPNEGASALDVTYRYMNRLRQRYREEGADRIRRRRPGPQCREETWEQRRQKLGDERWAELQSFRRQHHFTPNQLRHTAATWLRAEIGIDAARTVLGHTSASTTEIYAEQDEQSAIEAMEAYG